MDAATMGMVINMTLKPLNASPSVLQIGFTTIEEVRNKFEGELRRALKEPHLKIIHVDVQRMIVTCVTREPRKVLLECANSDMILCIMKRECRIHVGISIQGHILIYSDASEMHHVVKMCFPKPCDDEHQEDVPLPGIAHENATEKVHVAVTRDRFQMADQIQSIVSTICIMGEPMRIDASSALKNTTPYILIYYLHCTQRSGEFVVITVSDECVVIGGHNITHDYVLRNDDAEFATQLIDALKPYHKNAPYVMLELHNVDNDRIVIHRAGSGSESAT